MKKIQKTISETISFDVSSFLIRSFDVPSLVSSSTVLVFLLSSSVVLMFLVSIPYFPSP